MRRQVIDSEDIPLNVSRENMQDSHLMNRISKVSAHQRQLTAFTSLASLSQLSERDTLVHRGVVATGADNPYPPILRGEGKEGA